MKRKLLSLAVGCLLSAPPGGADTAGDESYHKMSLAELLNVEIVTSARTKQKLGEAQSTVKVITADDIRQLPVTTLGELLKLFVPGMDVRVEYDQLIKNYIGVRGLSGDSYATLGLGLLDRNTAKVRATHYVLDRRPDLYGSLACHRREWCTIDE